MKVVLSLIHLAPWTQATKEHQDGESLSMAPKLLWQSTKNDSLIQQILKTSLSE